MAFTQADVARVESLFARGVTSAEVAGEKLSFRSVAELKEIIAYMKAEISGADNRAQISYPLTTRGL